MSQEKTSQATAVEVKRVYEVWNSEQGLYKYLDPETDTKHEAQQPFVARERRVAATQDPKSFIDIHSNELRDALECILCDAECYLTRPVAVLEERFLYVMLPVLKAHLSPMANNVNLQPSTRRHLERLITYLEETHKATTDALSSLDHGMITFDLLWALFQPGSLAIAKYDDTEVTQPLKFKRGDFLNTGEQRTFRVIGNYISFDGEKIGETLIQMDIDEFPGVKRMASLAVFPLHLHSRSDDIKSELLESGRRFVQLVGLRHCVYRGVAYNGDLKNLIRVQVDSRIIIDPRNFYDFNPRCGRIKVERQIEVSMSSMSEIWDESAGAHSDATLLKEEDLMRCDVFVTGFSLEEKKWLRFLVLKISDINWQDQNLPKFPAVSDEDQQYIWSLARAHEAMSTTSPPFNPTTKTGLGRCILLHGPPGTGKTSFATAVAEGLRRPLYSISSVSEAENVTKNVTQFLLLARQWRAVLVWNNADAYMEGRGNGIDAEGRVLTFLHMLEACSGLLFLTTNRRVDADLAVLSRMHCIVELKALGANARRIVWRDCLESAELQATELEKLAHLSLDARQIRNVVEMAKQLAGMQHRPLLYSDIEQAMRSINRFFQDAQYISRNLYN